MSRSVEKEKKRGPGYVVIPMILGSSIVIGIGFRSLWVGVGTFLMGFTLVCLIAYYTQEILEEIRSR